MATRGLLDRTGLMSFFHDRRGDDHVDSSAQRSEFLLGGRVRFQSRDGLSWTVHEEPVADRAAADRSSDPSARGHGVLIFQSTLMTRQVRRYPGGWRHLSARELDELLLAP